MGSGEYKKLHAEWYELGSAQIDHSKEVDFWARSIQAAGEPVLELGSGTGRILLPLLERGFDVWGIDTSKEMLARCRTAAMAKGLGPKLYDQSMVELNLPQKFGLIMLTSGGLGLFVCDQDIHATFQRVMAHLRPGGPFIFEFESVPSAGNARNNDTWTSDWLNGPDGAVITWRRKHKYDASTRIWRQLLIIEKFIDGRLVETELNERVGRFFTVDEAVQFAKAAGFTEIRATNWLTEDPPSADARVVSVRCKKPAETAD